MANKPKVIDWRDKRCPKCGSDVDMLETCRNCGRQWSEHLERDEQGRITEEVIGLEPGQEHPSVVKREKPRKLGKRGGKLQKPPEQLAGKRFRVFSDDLPPEYSAWEVREGDDEAEIYRKRSLMRLDSRKIYNQMGLSVRAQESAKATLLWLQRMWGFLENEEQHALGPTLQKLTEAFEFLTRVRQAKIVQATKMEKAMEKAYTLARKARMAADAKRRKEASKFPAPEQDSEGLGLPPMTIDRDLLEQAKEKLMKLEKERAGAKRRKPEEPAEEGPETE
jgi:hypothetical protein